MDMMAVAEELCKKDKFDAEDKQLGLNLAGKLRTFKYMFASTERERASRVTDAIHGRGIIEPNCEAIVAKAPARHPKRMSIATKGKE